MAAVARGRPAKGATGPVQDPAIPPRMTEIDTEPEFCHQSTATPVTPQNPISKTHLYQPVKKSLPRHTRSTPQLWYLLTPSWERAAHSAV